MSGQVTPRGQAGQAGRHPAVRKRLTRPFAALPHDLIADVRLKATDVRLAGILLRYARDKAACWPSLATLGADLRRCRRTVQTSIKRLEGSGWVRTRPAPNPTGREFVMVWREQAEQAERDRHRIAEQLPYSQGLPREGGVQSPAPGGCNVVPSRGVQRPATEAEKKRKEGENLALATEQRKAPERPMSHAELLAQYRDVGWLDRPAGDPLRQIAERGLERALGAASGPDPGGGGSPGSVSLTGIVRGSRG